MRPLVSTLLLPSTVSLPLTDPFRDELQSALSPAYTIQRELTGGGMSRVFVALEHALGRTVVVKVLKPELGAGVNRERFRREIMLAAQLQHPHIVPVLSAGEHGDLLWYTMPFVEGVSLRDSLSHVGKFSPRTVTRVLHDVLDALTYAHRRGVIHRDIKPGNILHHGSHSLVTDFGVAKALSAALPHSGTTSVGIAIGTPAYMAPEQLAADPTADHRMDLYAVGLLAYELLTGVQPFSGSSPQATMAAQLTRMPSPIEEACPDVPPELASLVMRLLAKHPDDRPPTADAALSELENFTTPIGAPSSGTMVPATPPAVPSGAAAAAASTRVSRRTWLTVGALGLAAAAIAAMIVARTPSRSSPEDASAPEHLTADAPATRRDSIAAPAVHLTHDDSMRIAAAVREQLTRSGRVGTHPAAELGGLDSVQQKLVRVYTDSALRHAREALQAAGLSDVARLVAGESAAARARALGRASTGPSPGEAPRAPPVPRGAPRLTSGTRRGTIFARPRRVAILPVRNATPRAELGTTARFLGDSLRAALVAEGYTLVSDAQLLQLVAAPDPNVQRQLADSMGVGAVLTSILTTRGDEVLAQVLVLDVWRGYPVGARAAADLDKPQDALAVVRDVSRALERVSWRTRADPRRVIVFDLDNQTGIDSMDDVARQLTRELRTSIARRLGAVVAADSQSQATRDILERRAIGARLGAGAILAGSIYRARGETALIRLSIRDMSEDRSLPNIDVQVPRMLAAQQFGAVIQAVIAQLGQVNWGPKESR